MESIEKNVLALTDINFLYQKDQQYILKNLNISFESGKISAILGVNGCGKSTLLKILTGVLYPASGSLCYNGVIINDTNIISFKKLLGYMPENLNLYPEFFLEELLYFLFKLKGLDDRYNNIEEILNLLDLQKYKKMKLKTLSKGVRQRVNFAQSILGYPKIVVFDEPSNGFDCLSIKIFYNFLQNLAYKGTIIILTSHHLTEIYGKIDILFFLSNGTIIKKINFREIFFDEIFVKTSIEVFLIFEQRIPLIIQEKFKKFCLKCFVTDNDYRISLQIFKHNIVDLFKFVVAEELHIQDIFIENKFIEKLLVSYV